MADEQNPPDPSPHHGLDNAQATQAWMPGGKTTHTMQLGQNANDVRDRDDQAYMPIPFRAKLPKLENVPRLIYRDPPISSLSAYTLNDIRSAVDQHVLGAFAASGQLADKMTGDDRIAATLGSRVNGLLGLPFSVSPRRRAKDEDDAKEISRVVKKHWHRMAPKSEIAQMLSWGAMMGFAVGELIWNYTGGRWMPVIRSWHPQLIYYRYDLRQYIAITMSGPIPITPGDGKWILYTPRGEYRGWMHGAVRTTSIPWAYRQVFLANWARHSQKHGKPWILADVPSAWDEADKRRMLAALDNVGDETTLAIPQADPTNKFDVRLLEAQTPCSRGFRKGVYRMDTLISCAILGQNLTTEVQGGSYAAATVHGQIRQDFLESDAATLSECLRQQLLRPFCSFNFENGERLIPHLKWDVTPPDDKKMKADTLSSVSTAVKTLAEAGVPLSLKALADDFGIPIDEEKASVQPEEESIAPDTSAATEEIKKDSIDLTPSDLGAIITVDEARKSHGLPPFPNGEGQKTIAEFKAKHSHMLQAAAAAVETPPPPKEEEVPEG
jgi:phage gp29-like protein